MYFEIIRKHEVVARSDEFMSFSANIELNGLSSFSLSIPVDFINEVRYRCEIKVYLPDGSICHGLVTAAELDVSTNVIDIDCNEILGEWELECVPTNVVKKKEMISDLMNDPDTNYQETLWDIDVYDDYEIEYEYSRETKLEALDKTIEMTPDINYRVHRVNERNLEIAKFGEKKDYIVSSLNMLNNLSIKYDASNIINVATSYSDKNDGGSTSVTLRDVSADVSLQDERFPVIITEARVNTQAPPVGYSFTEYAPNNQHEFAVLDLDGIEAEDGDIYEGSFSLNDVSAVEENGEEISNEDRIAASKVMYAVTCRKLRYSRRRIVVETSVADLPLDVNVGDRIPFVATGSSAKLTECDDLQQENVFQFNDYLYLISFSINLVEDGTLRYDLNLSDNLAEYYLTREV
ncbi:MAG: hypothetical protein ACK5LJ_08075 [Paracoccus sp. (in: a-proteobacteria)]